MDKRKAEELYDSGRDFIVEFLLEKDKEIKVLKHRIDHLERIIVKLSKNSSNSSKPPSSDIVNPKSKKKRSKKWKIGGQPGHPRSERSLFSTEDIDEFHEYIYQKCPVCDNNEVIFLDAEPKIIQQIEVVENPLIRIEHRSYPVLCEKCQKIHYMPFPPEVVKEGLFKERLTALVAYMKHVDHASFSTIRKFIRDFLGEKVSRGYLRKVIEKVSCSLEEPYHELLSRLPLEEKLNVDETGHKENGKKFWTWVFKADLYILFKIDKSRGSKVLIDVLGKEFNGVLGCDYFSAYRKYMKDFNVTIQFCIAHLIRDIRYLVSLPDKETKDYGQRLLEGVGNLFKVIHEREEMPKRAFQNNLEDARESIMKAALENVPSCINKAGKEEKKEAQNIAKRFRDNGKAYFEFITTPGVAPTNNAAEQAIRFIVIDRRITQGTRSKKGRESNERIWTAVATCSLQGRSVYDYILKAVRAYFNNQPGPSLLPGYT